MLEKIKVVKLDAMFSQLDWGREDFEEDSSFSGRPKHLTIDGNSVDLQRPLKYFTLTLRRDMDYYAANVTVSTRGETFKDLSKYFARRLEGSPYSFFPLTSIGRGSIMTPPKKMPEFQVCFYSGGYHIIMGSEGASPRRFDDMTNFNLEMEQLADVSSKFILSIYDSVGITPKNLPEILALTC